MKLGVNVDHVATLRQARRINEPDPVTAAMIAEMAGADSIIMHLREDRRHIQDRDLELARKMIKTKLNLEMAATQEMVKIALDIRPDVSTIVPERREELTTEGGLDVIANADHLRKVVKLLQDAEIRVSLFVDPDPDQIKAAHRLGVESIEIHTGRYAEARREEERKKRLMEIAESARFASKLKLFVAAGHGLNYTNVQDIARIEEIEELNIGHSIIGRAVFVGIERAVREMKEIIFRSRYGEKKRERE
uniref:Pyridoxine 5-phosphate synthase n=1 Tax=uncultured prokaryote TaxID=198431 RepID=H5SPX3_9ZZZZ|nr:pyridoxine 5-phosphate synthase [uncultured prokaryote]